jgi:hypothetical protein
MAEATGGKYFNISLNSEHHINPFDLPVAREDESGADVLRSNIINLVGLFRIMLGGLTQEEDAIIDRAITETYASKTLQPNLISEMSSRRFFPTSSSCLPVWKERSHSSNDSRNTQREHGPALSIALQTSISTKNS